MKTYNPVPRDNNYDPILTGPHIVVIAWKNLEDRFRDTNVLVLRGPVTNEELNDFLLRELGPNDPEIFPEYSMEDLESELEWVVTYLSTTPRKWTPPQPEKE